MFGDKALELVKELKRCIGWHTTALQRKILFTLCGLHKIINQGQIGGKIKLGLAYAKEMPKFESFNLYLK